MPWCRFFFTTELQRTGSCSKRQVYLLVCNFVLLGMLQITRETFLIQQGPAVKLKQFVNSVMDGQGTYSMCPCDYCTCAYCDFNAKMIQCAALQSLHIPHIKALYIWSQVQLSQCLRQSSEPTITSTEETSWNQSVWVHTIWASSLSNCKNTNGQGKHGQTP